MTDDAETTPAPEKPALTPANKNPWYCLMTLHNPQVEGADISAFGEALHAQNRRDWNKWAARALTDDQRAALLEMKDPDGTPRFSAEELTPHNDAEWSELAAAFRKRAKVSGIKGLPDPARPVMCTGVRFQHSVRLFDFILPGPACFDNATFEGDANLASTIFNSDATFVMASFKRNADFSGTIFGGSATLSGATFEGAANLASASFEGYALLHSAIFKGEANFFNATFEANVDLSNATFKGETNFSNATFKRSISFAKARFRTYPPNFHEATLHSDTDWVGSRWPDPPANIEDAKAHVRYYQRLKQVMDTLKKHSDELDFFALELRAQRVIDWSEGKNGSALVNWSYQILSDYGRAIGRPLLALLAIMVLFGIIYDVVPMVDGSDLLPRQALGLSIVNTFGIVSFPKDATGIDSKTLTALMRSLGVVQAGLGALFLFLAGLGLRNRFRLK